MSKNERKGIMGVEVVKYDGPRHEVIILDGIETNRYYLSKYEVFSSLAAFANKYGLPLKEVIEQYNANKTLYEILCPAPNVLNPSVEKEIVDLLEEVTSADGFYELEPTNTSVASGRISSKTEVDPVRSAYLKGIPHTGTKVVYKGVEYKSIAAFARFLNKDYQYVLRCYHEGWTPTEIANGKGVTRSTLAKTIRGRRIAVTAYGKTYPSIKSFAEGIGREYRYICKQLEIGVSPETLYDRAMGKKNSKAIGVRGKSITAYGKTYPTQNAFAKAIGKDKSDVSKMLRSGLLPEEIYDRAMSKKISKKTSAKSKKRYMHAKSIVVYGKTYSTIKEFAEVIGKNYNYVSQMLLHSGKTPEQIYDEAMGKKNSNRNITSEIVVEDVVLFRGAKYPNVEALAKNYGKDPEVYKAQIAAGKTPEEALFGQNAHTTKDYSITYDGSWYPSRYLLCINLGLDYKKFIKDYKKLITPDKSNEQEVINACVILQKKQMA